MKALRILTDTRDCVVPLDQVALLVRTLRGLPADAFPSAANTATIFESGVVEETALAEVKFLPGEEAALQAALERLAFQQALPDGLRCLQHG